MYRYIKLQFIVYEDYTTNSKYCICARVLKKKTTWKTIFVVNVIELYIIRNRRSLFEYKMYYKNTPVDITICIYDYTRAVCMYSVQRVR